MTNNPFEQLNSHLASLREDHNELRGLTLQIYQLLANKNNNQDELLNIKQVGQLLGLSEHTIRGYVQKGEIPHLKKGKHLRFVKQEVLDSYRASRRKTKAERSEEVNSIIISTKKRGK